MKMFFYASLLSLPSLFGCDQKEQVELSKVFDRSEVSAVSIELDSWQLKIMDSSDDDIHVEYDGKIEKDENAPTVDVQDGVLEIVQKEFEEDVLSQFAWDNDGEITLYVPESLEGEVTIENGSGDIGISYAEQPENLSFDIASGSKDVTVKLKNASYKTETSARKQGTIGEGTCSLTVESGSGTVVVRSIE